MKENDEGEKGESEWLKQYKKKIAPKKLAVIKPLEFKTTFVMKRGRKKNCDEEENVSTPAVMDDDGIGIYKPKSDKTRVVYDEMFSIIVKTIANAPVSIGVRYVVNSILRLLKNDAVDINIKKRDINFILGPMPDHDFDRLMEITKLLTDYRAPDLSAFRVDSSIVFTPLENHIFK